MGIEARRGRGTAPAPAITPRPDEGPWWTRPRGAAVIVAALVAAAFARALANGFTYDEPLVIVQAQVFLKSSDLSALVTRDYFAGSLEGTWRPFCTLTYMLDAFLAFAPATFKAESVLWHIGAAWLVMALARRLLPERHRRFALVAGLVFALHPVTTETVDNASFREDSLVTFWTLATLVLAFDGRRAFALVAFALGLLSKESAVVAPVLLAIVRLSRPVAERPSHPDKRGLPRELAPYAAVLVAYLAIRFGPLKTAGQYAAYPGGSFGQTLKGMPLVWSHYLKLLVWPWPLCADYTGYFPFGHAPVGPVVLSTLLVLGFVAALVVAARRGQPLIAFGLGWFALTLGPVSNFIPVPIPAAERFLMLPLVGVGLAAAGVAGALSERLSPVAWRAALAGGVCVLAAFVVVVNLRHGAWRDDATLWDDTVAVNPRSCGAQSAVGGTLLRRGIDGESVNLLRDAVAHQQLALRLCTDASDPVRAAITYTRLGAAQALLGHLGPAHTALTHALALEPRYPLALVWLGYVSYLSGDREGAATQLKHAIIDLGPPESDIVEVARRYVDKI